MSAPAGRPIWEQHPLWLDRERLDSISQLMWFEIQKVMFPGRPPRPLRRPGLTELTVVGGTSAEDAYSEAVHALLRYEPKGDVNWEKVGVTIARRKAIDAVRKATSHRRLPDGTEIDITSLDLENEDGEPLVGDVADSGDLTDDEAVDRVLRAQRLVAFRKMADELPQRDRDIVFRSARGETYVAIARDVGLTEQRVGQIDREGLRKISAGLRRTHIPPPLRTRRREL